MKFIFRMAYREIRASWYRLLFFFLCIAIGVGSIISLRSIVQNIRTSVSRQAQTLLAADVQVTSSTPLNEETKTILAKYFQSAEVLGHAESIELATMLRPLNNADVASKQVELRAVQSLFPFYGEMVLSNGQAYNHSLLKDRGILVKPELLQQLNLKIGDKVKIGKLEFSIRGTIEREPGNTLTGFSLGPRIFANYDDIIEAGLTGPSARARYKVQFKTQAGAAENLTKRLKEELKTNPLISVRSFRDAENRVADSFTQVENFLSLIGLIILVLGGIGISSVTRVFIQQKIKTVAVMKCLGGKNSLVLGTYLVQVLALGLIGSILGVTLAKITLTLLPRYLADKIPPDIQIGLTWGAIAQGFTIGMLIAILFAALPLLEIRNIKPIIVLRATDVVHKSFFATLFEKLKTWWNRKNVSAQVITSSFDWLPIIVGGSVLAALLALAGWQAGSLKIGAIFLVGLGATTLILNGAGALLIKFVQRFRHLDSFVLRQGINSLYRPGNQTKVILLAVGLGAFFIISVRLLQANLLEEFNLNLGSDAADLYLIDIKPNDQAAVAATIQTSLGIKPVLIPTLRGRIAELNAKPVNVDSNDKTENRGMISRDYVMTYRDYLDTNEKLIAGKFWDSTPAAEPEISIEEMIHQELKINLGDSMTFDLAGSRFTAKVTSIRRVDWRNVRLGFFIVFRPGTLDNLPQQMLITAVKAPPPGAARVAFQKTLLDKFSNISVIDVRDILEAAGKVINTVTIAVTFVGGFVFLSGLLILIGSIAMTKYHRLYESAILKTLGAKRKLIIMITLLEYGVIGLLAGVIGSLAAILLSWSVSKYALDITWTFAPLINLFGVILTLILVALIGVLSSWDVMIKKPLGILRSE